MSGDYCPTIMIRVYVQNNGIIRLADTGRVIGRLVDDDDEVSFDKLSQYDIFTATTEGLK